MPGPSYRSRKSGGRRKSTFLPKPFSRDVMSWKFNQGAKKSRRHSRIKNALRGR